MFPESSLVVAASAGVDAFEGLGRAGVAAAQDVGVGLHRHLPLGPRVRPALEQCDQPAPPPQRAQEDGHRQRGTIHSIIL